MAKEYIIILGLVVLIILKTLVNDLTHSLIIWYPISILAFSIYTSIRHSTIYQKYRPKPQHYFIKSKYDQANSKNRIIIGAILIASSIVYYLIKDHFNINEDKNIVIISSLLILGLSDMIYSLFLTPNPLMEIKMTDYSIQFIRGGKLVREFYEIDSYSLSSDSLAIDTSKKRFELDSLEITPEQERRLAHDLKSFVEKTNERTTLVNTRLKRFKKHFSPW